jgi:hypothetical protein
MANRSVGRRIGRRLLGPRGGQPCCSSKATEEADWGKRLKPLQRLLSSVPSAPHQGMVAPRSARHLGMESTRMKWSGMTQRGAPEAQSHRTNAEPAGPERAPQGRPAMGGRSWRTRGGRPRDGAPPWVAWWTGGEPSRRWCGESRRSPCPGRLQSGAREGAAGLHSPGARVDGPPQGPAQRADRAGPAPAAAGMVGGRATRGSSLSRFGGFNRVALLSGWCGLNP